MHGGNTKAVATLVVTVLFNNSAQMRKLLLLDDTKHFLFMYLHEHCILIYSLFSIHSLHMYSGHGLSGMALLSLASFVAVPAMFAGGISLAVALKHFI